MRKVFDENFYTDDFDQEMIDYLVDSNWVVQDNDSRDARVDNLYLRFGSSQGHFWTTDNPSYYDFGELLTKQQFKEKIGMTNKQFTKSDLLDGMICTSRSGYIYTVQGDRMVRDGGCYIRLNDLREDLTVDVGTGDLDIVQVVQPTVLFTRQEVPAKSPAQIELEKLQKQIAALQGQANKLQQSL